MKAYYNRMKVVNQFLYKRLVLPFKNKSRQDRKLFNQLIGNKEFMTMMQISERTAQRWRSNGEIGYYKIRNRIYYSWSDIYKFYRQNYSCRK